jgi:HAD superfamily, subfamily IIIB (Acid phosphatase)
MHRRIGPLRGVLIFLAGALTMAAVGIAVGAGLGTKPRETSVSGGTSILGQRPTGVGMARIGAHGTVGAGEYTEDIEHYHDSGQYQRDLAAVGRRAKAFLRRRVARLRAQARRRCRRAEDRGLTGAALERACRRPKLAIVFDIDETSVSNYEELAATDFAQATPALVLAAAEADSPAIRPTHDLYRLALRKNVGVFFITGRPEAIPMAREATETQLRRAGYREYEELILQDSADLTLDFVAPYKSSKRAQIERDGWDIVLNVGDQESDLAGGHADRAYKLPNPFYFIG